MLSSFRARHIGPFNTLEAELSPRFNIITGDNGVGKSLILDLVWFALSGSPYQNEPLPNRTRDEKHRPSVKITTIHTPTPKKPMRTSQDFSLQFFRDLEQWLGDGMDFEVPSFCIYAGADGRYGVWDWLRTPRENNRQFKDLVSQNYLRPPRLAYADYFTSNEVLHGLKRDGKTICNGMIYDAYIWGLAERNQSRRRAKEAFSKALEMLSAPGEKMTLESYGRLNISDSTEFPSIKFDYGDTPVHLLSSGVRRIVEIAYLLVWAWTENDFVRQEAGVNEGLTSMLLLVDEVELHLHPKWQRKVLPALLQTIEKLEEFLPAAGKMKVQTIVTTHSPLVLASMETEFQAEKDSLFHMHAPASEIVLERLPLDMEGDVTDWLKSEIFNLGEARSMEAEAAILRAKKYMRQPSTQDEMEAIEIDLKASIHSQDEFMFAWRLFKELGDDSILETDETNKI
jgi:hypothetical protein